jgi:hypothetical protein
VPVAEQSAGGAHGRCGLAIAVPAAFANFPKEQWLPPRSYVERVFTNVRPWTNLPAGGHFGAMEQPHLLADELRAFAIDAR